MPDSADRIARPIPLAYFSMILGMSGLAYAWRSATRLWSVPAAIGESLLLLTALIWAGLLLAYLMQYARRPHLARQEFSEPVQGSTAALLGISTLVLVPGIVVYSRPSAWFLAALGIGWNLGFSIWHGGKLWQGERDQGNTTPALYLPAVAGNFTSAAALGVLGQPDWAWLLFGAGLFSWLTLDPIITGSIWHRPALAAPRRPLLGIQAAPPVVGAASLLLISPGMTGPWLLMLLGYGLFQLAQGLRLARWLGEQRFSRAYWAYTFGMSSALNCCLKLAIAGNAAAHVIALPLLAAVTAFITYLFIRSIRSATGPAIAMTFRRTAK